MMNVNVVASGDSIKCYQQIHDTILSRYMYICHVCATTTSMTSVCLSRRWIVHSQSATKKENKIGISRHQDRSCGYLDRSTL